MFSVIHENNREALYFSFKNRDNDNMIIEWGNAILKIAKEVDGGIIVFFPSYRLLDNLIDTWKENKDTQWERLSEGSIYEQLSIYLLI